MSWINVCLLVEKKTKTVKNDYSLCLCFVFGDVILAPVLVVASISASRFLFFQLFNNNNWCCVDANQPVTKSHFWILHLFGKYYPGYSRCFALRSLIKLLAVRLRASAKCCKSKLFLTQWPEKKIRSVRLVLWLLIYLRPVVKPFKVKPYCIGKWNLNLCTFYSLHFFFLWSRFVIMTIKCLISKIEVYRWLNV